MKMDTGKPVDRYGRVVAVAYLGQYPVSMYSNRSLCLTRNIEVEMLLNGWAWVLESYGPDEIYLEALEIARRNKPEHSMDVQAIRIVRTHVQYKQRLGRLERRRGGRALSHGNCNVW